MMFRVFLSASIAFDYVESFSLGWQLSCMCFGLILQLAYTHSTGGLRLTFDMLSYTMCERKYVYIC